MAMVLQPSRVRLTQAIYFGKPPGSGGLGTVTAVSQGNGIANTPNPIVGAGSVALGALTSDHDFGAFQIISDNSGDWINVNEHGVTPANPDNTVALDALIASLPANSGATLYFPTGLYVFGSGLATLNGLQEICFRGEAIFNAGGGVGAAGTVLRFTGVGAGNFITTGQAIGIRFENIAFDYTNAGFSGVIVNGDFGGFGLAYSFFDKCAFVCSTNVKTASAFISLENAVNVIVRDCCFSGAVHAIRGVNNPGNLSNKISLRGCIFQGLTGSAIRNPSEAWSLDACTFEPTDAGPGNALDFNVPDVAIGLAIHGCWFGDWGAGAGSWLTLNVSGCSITGNRFAGTALATAIDLSTGATLGVDISGNDFQVLATGINLSNGATAVTIHGNSFGTVTTPVSEGGALSEVWLYGNRNISAALYRNDTFTLEGSDTLYMKSGVGATNVGLRLGTDKTAGVAYIQSIEPATSYTSKVLSLNPNGGAVGIATVTPTRTLDLNGTQRWRGIAAPAVSEANSGTIYFDSATNKLKASLNGSAYVDVIGSGGLTGSGTVGQVAYWDGVTSLASPSGIYVDAVNNRLGINVPVPGYALGIDGDINFANSSNVIRVGGTQVFRAEGAFFSLAAGTNAGLEIGGTAIGGGALGATAGGSFNTAVGQQSLKFLTTAIANVACGSGALLNTDGDHNTGVGAAAGATNTTGTDNVFVGNSADANANNYTNAIAIGANAVVGASDSMVLGDAAMKVGIRTGTPAQPLDVDGAVAFRHKDIAVANGLNSDIALTDASLIRLTGATGAFSIGGFTGGTDGRVLRIINTAAQAMTIVNLDAGSAATNQITTLTGADVVLAARTSACTLVFEDASDTWILFSYN